MRSTCHSRCHSSRYGMRHGTCIGKTMAEVEEEEEEEKRLRGWPISVVAVEGAVPNDDSSKTTRRNAREEHEVSNEKTSENSAEVTSDAVLKTPDEWCRIQGVEVLDPDGWRGSNGQPWADPISLAEFQERLATCTQRVSRNHPWCDAPDCTVCDAGERRTDTLNLTGEGSPEPEPLRSVIDYLTDAAWRVNWKPDDKHPLQARYDALRSLMSIYAYATLVSLETLQRTDPGAADRVAEHLSHDDWDVRAECALLWHESLTGGARHAPFDEELHLLAGHHDLAIRQQVAEEIAVAIERSEDDARRAEKRTRDPGWADIATGYMRSAELAREIGAKA